tara:strand:- start:642 stop:833 length:192 start_codon:yes stop_codon:yes gene_type:complete
MDKESDVELYTLIAKNRKNTIDILYHKWGVELFKNPQYKIPQEDLKTMAWAKKELDKALEETA